MMGNIGNVLRRTPAPGEEQHQQNIGNIEALNGADMDPTQLHDNALIVQGYLESLNPDAPDLDLVSVSLLESYRRAGTAATDASEKHGEKQQKKLLDDAAKEIALQGIIATDTIVDSATHGIMSTTPGVLRHPTLQEIYSKKDKAQYRALAEYRKKIEEAPPNGPSRLTIAKRALETYAAIGGNDNNGSGVTAELFGIAAAGGVVGYDQDILRLTDPVDPDTPLSALSGIINTPHPNLLDDLHAIRDRYNHLQSFRMRKWKGEARKTADGELGEGTTAATTAEGQYRVKLEQVAAAIDAGAGSPAEKRALKTLVFNELAIQDAADQRKANLAESRMARLGERVGRLGRTGTVLLIGATAAAVTGIAIGTGGLGIGAGAAAAAVGGARVGRGAFSFTLANAKRYASLHLPGLNIASHDNAETANQVTAESNARITEEDRAKKIGLAIGAVALAAGSADMVVHFIDSEGVYGLVTGHGHNAAGGLTHPTSSYIDKPGTASPVEHPPTSSPTETSPGAHPTPTSSPTETSPGAHPTPTSSPTETSPGAHPTPTSSPTETSPKIPDITSAVNNLNATGNTVVQPGQGLDVLTQNLASHTAGLEGVHFTGEQLNTIQAEAGKQLVNIHYPDGTPVAYEMSPGEYGLTLDSGHALPDAATKVILQAAEQHASSAAATSTTEVFSGSTTDIAHSIATHGDANISSGEGFNAATTTIADHMATLHGFTIPNDQVSSIASEAAKNIYDQHITFSDGTPVAYIIQSGQYAGEYGIGGTGQLPESAVQIIVQTAEQHTAAIANTNGINLSTLGEFIKNNNISNISELINHLPTGATNYGNGEGLTTLLAAYSKIGFTPNTNYSLSAIAAQINSVQPHGPILALKGGRWVFTPNHGGVLSPTQIGQILQHLGFGQQDLTLAT